MGNGGGKVGMNENNSGTMGLQDDEGGRVQRGGCNSAHLELMGMFEKENIKLMLFPLWLTRFLYKEIERS